MTRGGNVPEELAVNKAGLTSIGAKSFDGQEITLTLVAREGAITNQRNPPHIAKLEAETI